MESTKEKSEEINVSFRGTPAEKLRHIVKDGNFKNNAELLVTALDMFERALAADREIIVPDAKKGKKYTYKL